MKKLRKAVQDYVALRRALGFKLEKVEVGLLDFVSFPERQGTSHITTERALQWATQPSHVQPFVWAQRLSFVRGFARHWSAMDPRTEIPPWAQAHSHPVLLASCTVESTPRRRGVRTGQRPAPVRPIPAVSRPFLRHLDNHKSWSTC